jgi:hypothetical protein
MASCKFLSDGSKSDSILPVFNPNVKDWKFGNNVYGQTRRQFVEHEVQWIGRRSTDPVEQNDQSIKSVKREVVDREAS